MIKLNWSRLLNVSNEKVMVLLMVIYPLFFIWQGLDFTDTGFALTNYQQIFSDPESVESTFRIWLTNVLGGVWIYFFGDSLGLLGYRIAAVLLVYATLFISFLTLQPYLKAKHLLFGLLLALIFINRSGFSFNYNSLTAFFYVLAVYFLARGLQEGKNAFVFMAAFVLGLNVFVRLPNVFGFVLIITILFFGRLVESPKTVTIRRLLIFTAGFISAVLSILFLMSLMGHLAGYLSVVKETAVLLKDPVGHHSTGKLMTIFVGNHKEVLAQTGFVLFSLLVTTAVLTASARWRSPLLQHLIIILLAFMSVKLFQESFETWFKMVCAILGILYMVLVVRTLRAGSHEPVFRVVSLASLIVLILVFLGSNVGILNSVYGMYLPLAILFSFFINLREIKMNIEQDAESVTRYHLRLAKNELKLIKVITIVLFLFFTVQSAYDFTYRDSLKRSELVYGIEHPRLQGIFTTEQRARVVEELLFALPQYVGEGEYLLAFEQIPMVHFLTKTNPYLYNSWPMLYSPEKFERSLKRAEKERPHLPVIVRAKGSTENLNWPKSVRITSSEYLAGSRKAMEAFISRYKYQVRWENAFFEILVPGVNDQQ